MKSFFAVCLAMSSCIATINAFRPCTLLDACPDDPYSNGKHHYIGHTFEDCSSDHIFVCSKRSKTQRYKCRKDACYMVDYYAYTNCFDAYGKENPQINPYAVSFENPFKECGNTFTVTVNANDSKCYYSSNGNRVLTEGKHKRTAKAIKQINGRCLVEDGWCPCGSHSEDSKPSNSNNSGTYSQPGKSRCLRKLPNVKWVKKDDKLTVPLTKANVDKFCNMSSCQYAYDDENRSRSKRDSDWSSCKNEILNQALEIDYYGYAKWYVKDDTVNYY